MDRRRISKYLLKPLGFAEIGTTNEKKNHCGNSSSPCSIVYIDDYAFQDLNDSDRCVMYTHGDPRLCECSEGPERLMTPFLTRAVAACVRDHITMSMKKVQIQDISLYHGRYLSYLLIIEEFEISSGKSVIHKDHNQLTPDLQILGFSITENLCNILPKVPCATTLQGMTRYSP